MSKSRLLLAAIPFALAMAAPNLAWSEKQDKVSIHHCGCDELGTTLVCQEKSVNLNSVNKGRGHQNHAQTDLVYCEYSASYFVRDKNDCGHADLAGGESCEDGGADECTQADVGSSASCGTPGRPPYRREESQSPVRTTSTPRKTRGSRRMDAGCRMQGPSGE